MPLFTPWSSGHGIRCRKVWEAALWLGCGLAVLTGCSQTARQGRGGWKIGAIFALHKDEPAGEEWTILCLEARDRNRVENCDALLAALRRVNLLDASRCRVVHERGVSRIYYGSYFRTVEPNSQRETFTPQVRPDLQRIRSLAAGQSFPFASARVVPRPTADPGRPEWALRRCPGDYSLQIGVFYNTATFNARKEAAVQWVEQLRKEGIEAYYHHGEVRSSVTVGHFAEKDIIREQVGPKFATAGTRVRYSDGVRALREQERFKYNLENGHKVKRIRNTLDGLRKVPQESFLIPVPKKANVETPKR